MQFVGFVLIGLVAGWLARTLMKGGGFGVIGDIVVGVLGAVAASRDVSFEVGFRRSTRSS